IVHEEQLMRRLFRPAAVLLLLAAVTMPAAADKAKNLYNKARDAEARDNFEQAFELYKEAFDLKPKDLTYRASYIRLRPKAADAHIKRGRQLRDAGKLDEALAEFQKAAQIDPSSA